MLEGDAQLIAELLQFCPHTFLYRDSGPAVFLGQQLFPLAWQIDAFHASCSGSAAYFANGLIHPPLVNLNRLETGNWENAEKVANVLRPFEVFVHMRDFTYECRAAQHRAQKSNNQRQRVTLRSPNG